MNLSIEKISKSYNERIVLDNISFGVNSGETVGILGLELAKQPSSISLQDLFLVILAYSLCLEQI